MLYTLFEEHLRLLRYITFRAAMAAVAAFGLTLLFAPRVIAWLRRKKIGERVEKGDSVRLDEMHRAKNETPTMGGIFMVLAVIGATFLFGRTDSSLLGGATAILGSYGLLGFADDYIKLALPGRKGLKGRTKIVVQFAVAIGIGCWLYYDAINRPGGSSLLLPFFKAGQVDLGRFYPLFVALVIVGSSNAVNITDGLDGLAAGSAAIVALVYAVIAYVTGRSDFSHYLWLPCVEGSGELSILCAALTGACLGFLWFNCHPAQVFMGDVGALPIGGVLGYVAVVTKQEILLVFVGGLFVIEALSVIVQVAVFKTTGRRVFRIAPLHHHFQFAGWPEAKITVRFWILAAMLAFLGLATLKVR